VSDKAIPRDPALADVARLAGVSHMTVSRVLNNHPNVREQTRLRVRAAIAELGYRPNRAARSLATGRSQLLGAVALNTTLFGPASMLTAFEQAAAEAGFGVSVASVAALDRRSTLEAVERHLDQRVAGIVGERRAGPCSGDRTAGHSRRRSATLGRARDR
jgi:DNA-binding LacI/PurR family transcriptional regulator